MQDNIKDLFEYLNHDKSAYHAASYCEQVLCKEGFTQIFLNQKFDIKAGEKYYIKPYNSSLFAFVMPEKIESMRLAMAHTDFPTFKIKPVMNLRPRANCNLINVEPYGGSLKKTWFDRPLGIAGTVVVKTENVFNPKELLFDSEVPWVVIPSLAPHMDREIEKKEIDAAKEINPISALILDGDNNTEIIDLIAKKLDVNKDDILSYDLNLYDVDEARLVGTNQDFIQAGKIDNMASCAVLTDVIANATSEDNILRMIALFDNEEIGSRTKQGADSDILKWIITKICLDSNQMKNESEIISMLSTSMMLSCDGAHAVHPNYTEKADTSTIAEIGKGVVIKTSSSQRYVTDAKSIGIIKGLCENNNIAYQLQANKSGSPGGSTLGPIISSYLPILAVDMGVPMLAMHSIKEMIAVKDYISFEEILKAFYK